MTNCHLRPRPENKEEDSGTKPGEEGPFGSKRSYGPPSDCSDERSESSFSDDTSLDIPFGQTSFEQFTSINVQKPSKLKSYTVLRTKSRPLPTRGEIGDFLKGSTRFRPLTPYMYNIHKNSKVYLVNVRNSIVFNNWIWRLHSFLERMHHMDVNRKSKRLFYRLSTIDVNRMLVTNDRSRNVSRLINNHPKLRIFA